MICQNCNKEVVGHRCGYCGAIPKENIPPVTLADIMFSRKFGDRYCGDQKKVCFELDHIPWDEWPADPELVVK